MATSPSVTLLDLVDEAVSSVGDLGLRRVGVDRWERRSAQVWYRVSAVVSSPGPTGTVQVFAALVVPLLDRLVGTDGRPETHGTIGGNVLRFDKTVTSEAAAFDVVSRSRRGRVAARLMSPVTTPAGLRKVFEGQPFVQEVSVLLRAQLLPWVDRVQSWGDVAALLAAEGSLLVERGLCRPDHDGLRAILLWASGDNAGGERLMMHCYPVTRQRELVDQLRERFQPVPTL